MQLASLPGWIPQAKDSALFVSAAIPLVVKEAV